MECKEFLYLIIKSYQCGYNLFVLIFIVQLLFLSHPFGLILTFKHFADIVNQDAKQAVAYSILQFQLLSSGNLAIELNIYIWKEKLGMINAIWCELYR
jgi:hypothetical protein